MLELRKLGFQSKWLEHSGHTEPTAQLLEDSSDDFERSERVLEPGVSSSGKDPLGEPQLGYPTQPLELTRVHTANLVVPETDVAVNWIANDVG